MKRIGYSFLGLILGLFLTVPAFADYVIDFSTGSAVGARRHHH